MRKSSCLFTSSCNVICLIYVTSIVTYIWETILKDHTVAVFEFMLQSITQWIALHDKVLISTECLFVQRSLDFGRRTLGSRGYQPNHTLTSCESPSLVSLKRNHHFKRLLHRKRCGRIKGETTVYISEGNIDDVCIL